MGADLVRILLFTGVSLKKKQMWTLEPAEKDLIAFKSHLDKYLSVDQVRYFPIFFIDIYQTRVDDMFI